MFVAALIAAVVFAAAITVPGGNNQDNGLPIFSIQNAFGIFAISDALCLFCSVSSILMFLSILTSRYAADDFLFALPNRLIIGLATLFFAIPVFPLSCSCLCNFDSYSL
ncbi:Ankyrin repeat family protein [Forsythia ovata]|uniref:Ankyrin repeat family protein n=1 Tax=Forsythia ovata TaxID=205694 RepID=A0ABD1X0W5_9LAMI